MAGGRAVARLTRNHGRRSSNASARIFGRAGASGVASASVANTADAIGFAAVNGRCEDRRHRAWSPLMFSVSVLAVAFLVDWRVPSPSLSLSSHRVRPPANCAADMGSADGVTTPASASESAASTGAAAAASEAAWWADARTAARAPASSGMRTRRSATTSAVVRGERRVLQSAGSRRRARRRRSTTSAFSWTSPSDVDDPVAQRDWGEMCRKFAAYRAAEGDGQVPKKYKLDPARRLGGGGAPRARDARRGSNGRARRARLRVGLDAAVRLGLQHSSASSVPSEARPHRRPTRRRRRRAARAVVRGCSEAYAKGQLPPSARIPRRHRVRVVTRRAAAAARGAGARRTVQTVRQRDGWATSRDCTV